METIKKSSIRGAIKSLAAVGDVFVFPRNDDYKPSTVRNTASSVRCDTGRRFRVEVGKECITVIRKS